MNDESNISDLLDALTESKAEEKKRRKAEEKKLRARIRKQVTSSVRAEIYRRAYEKYAEDLATYEGNGMCLYLETPINQMLLPSEGEDYNGLSDGFMPLFRKDLKEYFGIPWQLRYACFLKAIPSPDVSDHGDSAYYEDASSRARQRARAGQHARLRILKKLAGIYARKARQETKAKSAKAKAKS